MGAETDPADWASSMSHDAAHGALPTFGAATALDARPAAT